MKKKNNIPKSAFFLIRSICLFILLYLAFFAVGVGVLWYACGLLKSKWTNGYLPYDLPIALPIILFFGSILLIVKMFGSLSAIQKINRPDLKEVTRAVHPQLFQLIDEVSSYMEVSVPDKVYLSATVSASVFLKTGIWNLLFSSKKQLEIGMGLINVLTQEELRAVLAHEFAHFSQKTLKLNKPVYAIGQSVQYIQAKIEIKKRGAIEEQYYLFAYTFRWLSNVLFSKLSKDFDSLSEMLEYDADQIAAEYVGKDALESALLKVSFSFKAFYLALNSIAILASSEKGINNLYEAQNSMASVLRNSSLRENYLSNLTEKRINQLQALETKRDGISKAIPASGLLSDYEEECKHFTKSIYQYQLRIPFSLLTICSLSLYKKWIEKNTQQWTVYEELQGEVEVEIALQGKLHKLPLTDLVFEVYWDGKLIGIGKSRKGFSLKIQTSADKHILKLKGQYIKDIPLIITIERTDKHIIQLNYDFSFWKSEYRFFIQRIEYI